MTSGLGGRAELSSTPRSQLPPSPNLPDREFAAYLRAARAGDEAAWRALYDWLAPQILGFLRASHLADPEDVLGDVFLDVARRVDGFKGDARGFRAWAFTVARARRVDEIRRRVRRVEDPIDTAVHEMTVDRANVEQEALAMVGLEELLGLVGQLTDDQGEVIILRALGGWSAREIGEITGRTIGSVEQLQHRGIEALRSLLRAT
jgi:RNA polymerase sigma-70 factor (ECF subfamily)